MSSSLSRREFLAATAASALAFSGSAAAQGASLAPPPVCVFSKHLQHLTTYRALATQVKRLEFDGVDLTVREGGHVLPDRVAEDLPRAVEVLCAEGIEVPMITTRIADGRDATARSILEAASKLGIKFVRIGGHRYPPMGDPIARIEACAKDMGPLVELLDEFDMYAGYHNHSGMLNVGAPVWDLHYLFEAVGSPRLGANFDLGHAMVEGTFGDWQITTRLMTRHAKMMSVKDFVWNGAQPKWTPLGEGIVPITEILRLFWHARFNGPISIHFEYDMGDIPAAMDHMAADLATLRGCLREAGYA
ncbi:MAG TPA: TIM barrel protein [Candidatus Hydrogenedentes bacterium]|nr:TIM barrel protein [Candidatus Hydrogenedentota bacterium]